MGNNFSADLAQMDLDLEHAVTIQLRSNHYPPVPLSMVEPCVQAIEAYNDGDVDKLIKLPFDGIDENGEPFQIKWKGQDYAPAWAIIEGHHLEEFCQDEDNYLFIDEV